MNWKNKKIIVQEAIRKTSARGTAFCSIREHDSFHSPGKFNQLPLFPVQPPALSWRTGLIGQQPRLPESLDTDFLKFLKGHPFSSANENRFGDSLVRRLLFRRRRRRSLVCRLRGFVLHFVLLLHQWFPFSLLSLFSQHVASLTLPLKCEQFFVSNQGQENKGPTNMSISAISSDSLFFM